MSVTSLADPEEFFGDEKKANEKKANEKKADEKKAVEKEADNSKSMADDSKSVSDENGSEKSSSSSGPDIIQRHEAVLAGLIEPYACRPDTVPAVLTNYLVIGGLHHAERPWVLQDKFKVTHIFSCIHSNATMCIEKDVESRRQHEAMQLREFETLEEAAAAMRALNTNTNAAKREDESQRQPGTKDSNDPAGSGQEESESDFSLAAHYGALGITYSGVNSDDQHGYEMLKNHKEAFFAFCDTARSQNPRARIYVHCSVGKNRSGCLATAYVMCKERRRLSDVVRDFLAKRGYMLTNSSFRRQLIHLAKQEGLLE